MTPETIMRRLEKGGWLKKDGSIKAAVKDMAWALGNLAKGFRYYPLRWGSGWSSLEGQSKYDRATALLTALRIPYIEGNDAPKGGVTGNYIEVKKAARKRLAEILKTIQL